MQIKNWQTFSNVSLECKNFLVFIGESSTGKSSLVSFGDYWNFKRGKRACIST